MSGRRVDGREGSRCAESHALDRVRVREVHQRRLRLLETATGLASRVIRKGTGTKHPTEASNVQVHYSGWTTDGKLFDSSVTRGQPASFPLNRVIKGWTEALQLMKVGAKWKVFIPSDLEYQEAGNNSIGPNETLVFEVELLGISARPSPPEAFDLNLTDSNTSSADTPLIIPQKLRDLSPVDKNATAPSVPDQTEDGNGSD